MNQWTPAIKELAQLIVSEFNMRNLIGHQRDYHLGTGETIDVTEASLTTGMNWDKNFQYLGRRYFDKRPQTLWCDLYALSLLYSRLKGVQIFIQPFFCEINRQPDEPFDHVCLKLMEPSSLNQESAYSNVDGRHVVVIPVFMNDHNPSVIVSLISTDPSYRKQSLRAYRTYLFDLLTDTQPRSFYQAVTDLPADQMKFFSPDEVDEESLSTAQRKKKSSN